MGWIPCRYMRLENLGTWIPQVIRVMESAGFTGEEVIEADARGQPLMATFPRIPMTHLREERTVYATKREAMAAAREECR